MTQEKQTADELRWVTMMTERLGITLQAPPEKQKEPKPDVLLTLTDGSRIAVEIVEAMDETLRKGYAGTLDRIVHNVTQGMLERGLHANVSLCVDTDLIVELAEMPGKEQRAVSAAIVKLLAETKASTLPRIYQDASPDVQPIGNLHLIDGLASNGIRGFRSIVVNRWHEAVVLTAAHGKTPGPDLVQRAIDKKGATHASYDTVNVGELWLLVVGSMGSHVSIDMGTVERHTFTSVFDRTYFLDCWEKRCGPLTTTK